MLSLFGISMQMCCRTGFFFLVLLLALLCLNDRLCTQRHPEIHLFAARLKEQGGDISGARAAYQLVHTGIAPGLLEAIIKHANMEHRLVRLQNPDVKYRQSWFWVACNNWISSVYCREIWKMLVLYMNKPLPLKREKSIHKVCHCYLLNIPGFCSWYVRLIVFGIYKFFTLLPLLFEFMDQIFFVNLPSIFRCI